MHFILLVYNIYPVQQLRFGQATLWSI